VKNYTYFVSYVHASPITREIQFGNTSIILKSKLDEPVKMLTLQDFISNQIKNKITIISYQLICWEEVEETKPKEATKPKIIT
jgi:hypothetical protein